MNTLTWVIGAFCVMVLGYRFYAAFLAAKVLTLDDRRITPAHTRADGQNYVASPRLVVFGHHFAAIAGAGPLIGPTLAAQFGFAPGFLWIVLGAVLAGCVHDFTVLVASTRHQGRSLPDIARSQIGPFAGVVTLLAVLFILLVTLAGLGIVVVNALAQSPWGVFTISMTVPIAILMGFTMFKSAPGKVRIAAPTLIGIPLLVGAVIGGHAVAQSSLASLLSLSGHQVTLMLMLYGLTASSLPMWFLLEPRDYLVTYVKLGTIAFLCVGILIVHPQLQFPLLSQYIHGGGPIIHGQLFPFLFVTIACGAISGFHSLIASGTTPKMLDREADARFVGYGAMLAESLVAVMALIAACSLHPGDYYAINVAPSLFGRLHLHTVELGRLSSEVGENLAGRTGGGVSLAIGMAQIFRGIPYMDKMVGYWYHYAVMFEALFILTTVDAGTRTARYILQGLLGRAYPRFTDPKWIPGIVACTATVVWAWGYLIYTGSISTIWPLFGTGNQLLATIALAVGTVYLVNNGKGRYAWTTALPMIFVGVTTFSAGILSTRDTFWPLARQPGTRVQGYLDSALMILFMVGVVLVVTAAARRCVQTLHGRTLPPKGPPLQQPLQKDLKTGCC